MTLFPCRSFVWTIALSLLAVAAEPLQYTAADDASWAIFSPHLSDIIAPDKQALYDQYIADCTKTELGEYCPGDDGGRMEMNRLQPSSVYNYTHAGYQKIRVPSELFELIRTFWETNKDRAEVEWKQFNTFHNMWDAPPDIVKVGNVKNTGGGSRLEKKISDFARPVMEEWTGQKLKSVSLYGIRVYYGGSILAPHVDRMPLVTSAIINVDQEVDEPWPLEVYGHDGKATNVTMEPGDMVLYESHSVIHGRPFPFKGNFYANIFVHFEPQGPLDQEGTTYDEDIPPYLVPGSKWEKTWLLQNPDGWSASDDSEYDIGSAAINGEIDILENAGDALHEPDEHGWLPLHEAVRAGQVGAVQFILKHGGNINHETYSGMSPLNIALEYLGEDHEMTKFLENNGAVDLYPEL